MAVGHYEHGQAVLVNKVKASCRVRGGQSRFRAVSPLCAWTEVLAKVSTASLSHHAVDLGLSDSQGSLAVCNVSFSFFFFSQDFHDLL